MCGIVGYAGRSGALTPDMLAVMRDSLEHRGPDAAGIWSTPDGSVIFGHRRLSIIDLSVTGAQPMEDNKRSAVVVFNGEIYNHEELRQELAAGGVRFVGRSDTEVLLAAYGVWQERCVERLRGMFAFAIFDRVRQILFLARDRIGEKPLYWTRHRDGLVFASELKALMADPCFPRRLSPEGLAYYLSFGYVPGDQCILEQVHKLRPAHCLTWSLTDGQLRTWRYWDLPADRADDNSNVDELTDELQHLLTRAVGEQLVADVPLGVLLSGGVDSSIVAAVAARSSDRAVHTFTVTLPEHPQLDERRFARTVASYLGTNHVELPLDKSSVDLIWELAAQYDEPIADSSMIPTYLLAKTVRQHCKVVLGGDGADELFGGYLSYQSALRREELQAKLPYGVRSLTAAFARALPAGSKGRNYLLALEGTRADSIAQSAIWTDVSDFKRISPWLDRRLTAFSPKRWRQDRVESVRGLPAAAMAADMQSYLPEDILVKVDRASMLCSLEMRAPFLDRRVVEFAYECVPNSLRATKRERKILLRALARRLLPPTLDIDRKQGFTIPISKWLTTAVLQRWTEECRDEIQSVLSTEIVRKLIRRHTSAAAEHSLFAFIILTSWMRHYRIAT